MVKLWQNYLPPALIALSFRQNMHNVTKIWAYTEIKVITIKEDNRLRLVREIVIAGFNGLIYYPDNNLAHNG